jgi:hypothetical protein
MCHLGYTFRCITAISIISYQKLRIGPTSQVGCIPSPEQVNVHFLLRTVINDTSDCNTVAQTRCNTGMQRTRFLSGYTQSVVFRLQFVINRRSDVRCHLVLWFQHVTSLHRWMVQLWIRADSPSTLPPSPSPLWVNAMWAALINLPSLLLPTISPLLWTLGFTSCTDVAIKDLQRPMDQR